MTRIPYVATSTSDWGKGLLFVVVVVVIVVVVAAVIVAVHASVFAMAMVVLVLVVPQAHALEIAAIVFIHVDVKHCGQSGAIPPDHRGALVGLGVKLMIILARQAQRMVLLVVVGAITTATAAIFRHHPVETV